ncbi:MAG TPA: formate dehydrogenase subunit delta [Steroidobacteraceae bacterium]|nr:formate dehydrogenase subunit delta [Steroidobacteraceae bacterium]
MNIDLLIKMANEIGMFFNGATADAAARDVATHLKRYWDPRMRRQIIGYLDERHGAGLSDVARAAVEQLRAESAAGTPAPPP